MDIVFNFHLVEDGLPEKSGEYYVITSGGFVDHMDYSKRHKMFNVFDFDKTTETAIGVIAWADVPDELKAIKEEIYK